METLLVTGGAGFIGSNFVHFVRNHHPDTKLVVLDALTYAGNLSNIASLLRPAYSSSDKRVEFIHGSINDVELVDSIVQKVDAVVHFAAESHNDKAIVSPDIFFETNVMGTLTLLKAAQRYDVRFHHISTDEVYGDTDINSQELFTEDSPYKPSSPYAASKAASDHMVRAWTRTYGLKATISNCSNNFGAYQHIEKFIPRAITNALCGIPIKLYGDGLAMRDWIHVEDQCRAIWEILHNGRIGQTYLVSAQCVVNNKTVIDILCDIMRTQFDCDPCIQYVRDRAGADRRYALNPQKIRQELGWKPEHTQFSRELESVVRWYSSNEDWWKSEKSRVEEQYQILGQ
ncbi:dTDP-glucose 4,6-dehydratase [Alloscardovia theropitheci]|uniref:dTDP-glucose 4,6-dehydratase n=1 Tax=Alloscardovia theropitheci TaxID=2496842 RepID=A0A4R0QPK1_9BIFI|nr:dTDP-glucose 4,6-dehydratase [Alloscardovia theropitheci]TCD54153.1 dTDP-glucose 4,6-dehydratase [Alloscardovia theropitheci]